MSNVNANQFPEMYADLGVEVNRLGCVMIDVEPISVTSYIPGSAAEIASALYKSDHPDRFWINGAVGETKSHITLLYGLLSKEWQQHIRTVLDGWDAPTHIYFDGLEVFPSPMSEENYSCIVARVGITEHLQEGRARLEMLPHVNTFLEWKAHVTLAYVRPEYEAAWVEALKENLPRAVRVTGIDIGDQRD